ncbi:MAG: type II secretion system F family protein [Pirellulales bacterium]|nr:type II secretion system F family protein [Pirellulales bacterium]
MTTPLPETPPTLTLQQWIALNEEIAALVRLGVPLEQSLADLGRDLPGTLGAMAARLAERAARGESLPQILAEDAEKFPPVYRAIVTSGIRAGRLPTALESLSRALRRTIGLRRFLMAALLYPLAVFGVAWLFFAFFTAKIAPVLAVAFRDFHVPAVGIFTFLSKLGNTAFYWGTAVPIAVVLLYIAASYFSYRTPWNSGTSVGWLLNHIPGMGKLYRWARNAMFTETLALLVENQVPLAEALPLAGQACGDPRLLAAVRRAAEALQQGRSPGAALAADPVLPPLLQWLIPSGMARNALLPALRQAAEMYHLRAERQSEWMQLVLPLVLTLGFAGGLTLIYAVLLFAPYAEMLKTIGAP